MGKMHLVEISMRKTTKFSMSFPLDSFQKFSNFSVGGRVVAHLLQEARSKGLCCSSCSSAIENKIEPFSLSASYTN
jgi:hypothetical protein